jgi:transcriptional regulator with XRE-family HTH domain
MSNLTKRFGRLLVGHRTRRRLTQEQLAQRIEMSVDMISRMESGTSGASFNTIEKLARALDIDPGQLFVADLPDDERTRTGLNTLIARLAKMSARELGWVEALLDIAVKRPR